MLKVSTKKAPKEGKREKRGQADRFRQACVQHRKRLLEGRVLAIDPSSSSGSGGKGSKPGIAIYENGVFKEAGYLETVYHPDLSVRLRRIHEDFEKEFKDMQLSAIIIEQPPDRPIRSLAQAKASGKPYLGYAEVHMLAQSIGCIIAAFPSTIPLLRCPALTWHAFVKKQKPEFYTEKDDPNDAQAMLACAIWYAQLATETD